MGPRGLADVAIVPVGVGRGDLSNEEWVRLGPHLPKDVGRGGCWKTQGDQQDPVPSVDRHPVAGSAVAVREVETVHDRHPQVVSGRHLAHRPDEALGRSRGGLTTKIHRRGACGDAARGDQRDRADSDAGSAGDGGVEGTAQGLDRASETKSPGRGSRARAAFRQERDKGDDDCVHREAVESEGGSE